MSERRAALLQTKARLLSDVERMNTTLSEPCTALVAKETEAALVGTRMLLKSLDRILGEVASKA
jgi:hypothetical protein